MREAGESLEAIAEKFGKTIPGVCYATKHCSGVKRRNRKPQWAPAADAFMLENYGPMSASQIGRHFGVSRNAIIGRVFRLRRIGVA